jgi:hypothetical protein
MLAVLTYEMLRQCNMFNKASAASGYEVYIIMFT